MILLPPPLTHKYIFGYSTDINNIHNSSEMKNIPIIFGCYYKNIPIET